MKILFATDGSPCALAALKGLADRLPWFRDPLELTVLNVHLPIPYKGAATHWVGKEALDRYYQEEGDAALQSTTDELARRGIAHRVEKRVGDPAETIVATARDEHFDLIAMGTRGHTTLESLVLGSVATKVLAHAPPVPVLLLR
jgi:nucleotide-binding universal stress UspA family protein